MAQAGQRWIHRTDHKFDTAPFERQHLRVAKGLRDYWVTRVKIAKSHCGKRIPETESNLCNVVGQARRLPISSLNSWRYGQSSHFCTIAARTGFSRMYSHLSCSDSFLRSSSAKRPTCHRPAAA